MDENTRVSPDLIGHIRFSYRLCKSAQGARLIIDQKLVSYARVYLTEWHPHGKEVDREKANRQALRCISLIRKLDKAAKDCAEDEDSKDQQKAYDQTLALLIESKPTPKDRRLVEIMKPMVLGMEPARQTFAAEENRHEKIVRRLARQLPAWAWLKQIRGFSEWGLGVLVGEFGDWTDDIFPAEDRKHGQSYSGVRRIYKRLGWAPKEAYPVGEKKTGRMIPRRTKGHIYGIIAEPLLKAQWAGERGPNGEKLTADARGRPENIPARAIGPYGYVFGGAKARALQSGKSKGHAQKLAMRVMIKALLHDVHRAWHGLPPDYVFTEERESQPGFESPEKDDLPSSTSRESRRLSHPVADSQLVTDQPAAPYQ